jgi:short-subunit dehydrogenase
MEENRCNLSLTSSTGTVVNQASVAAIQGFNRPYMGIYSSSKAAVYSLSDTMRVEFAPFDVKVLYIPSRAPYSQLLSCLI